MSVREDTQRQREASTVKRRFRRARPGEIIPVPISHNFIKVGKGLCRGVPIDALGVVYVEESR